MRAIYCGLLAAGMTVAIIGNVNASSGGFGGSHGFAPLPFGHLQFGHHGRVGHMDRRIERGEAHDHDRGDDRRQRHFWSIASDVGPEILDVSSATASDPPAAGGDLVIYAPNYVPAPVRRPAISGPKIITIGAQPAGRLPVVIYGSRLADATN